MDNDELLKISHEHINGYIKFADQKASILLSGQIASLALVLNLVPSNWSDFQMNLVGAIVLSLLALIVAIIFSLLTIFPRSETKNDPGFIFWENVLAHGDSTHFGKSVSSLTQGDAMNSLSNEVYNVSIIAKRKYSFLKWSIIATGGFLIFSILSIIIYLY